MHKTAPESRCQCCYSAAMASIKQYRGKTWRAIVRRKGFPPESKTFALKSDAEAWAAKIEARMGVSSYDPLQLKMAKVTTVKSLFERYRDEVAKFMKGRNEYNTVDRLIRNAKFMNLLVSKVGPQDIREWRDNRLAGDKDAKIDPISPQSVGREMNTISGAFTYAIKEWGVALAENPCHLVSRPSGGDVRRNKRWMQADIDTFLKAAKWSEDQVPKVGRDYVGWALLLAIETAMREGELCILRVQDFYPAELRVHLHDSKNGDERDVPLTKKAIQYFEHLCKGKKPTDKIIPIGANTLGEYTLDVRRKCGLEHLHFHDSRHEAATRLSKKLPNVLVLSAQTGHRSLNSLKRYYNPTAAEIAAQLD